MGKSCAGNVCRLKRLLFALTSSLLSWSSSETALLSGIALSISCSFLAEMVIELSAPSNPDLSCASICISRSVVINLTPSLLCLQWFQEFVSIDLFDEHKVLSLNS
jgi:hypothetical protein